MARKRPWYVAACLPPLLVWAVWFPSVTGLHAWHLFSGRYALVLALLVGELLSPTLGWRTIIAMTVTVTIITRA